MSEPSVDRRILNESERLVQDCTANNSWSQDSNLENRLLSYTPNHSSEVPFSSQPTFALSLHFAPHPQLPRDKTLWDLQMEALPGSSLYGPEVYQRDLNCRCGYGNHWYIPGQNLGAYGMERGKGRGLNRGYSSIYSIGKNRRNQQKRQKEQPRKPRERILLVTFWLLASN